MAYIEQEEKVFKPVKLVLEHQEEVTILMEILKDLFENQPRSPLAPKAKEFENMLGQYVPF